MAYRFDWLFWFALFFFAGWAMAAPAPDVFRENFGVDRIVAVAAMLGGFCAVTFSGSLSLSVAGVLGSLASAVGSAAVGLYCGAFAAPLISALFGGTIGAAAPAPSAFLVAWGAPLLYSKLAALMKKEPS